MPKRSILPSVIGRCGWWVCTAEYPSLTAASAAVALHVGVLHFTRWELTGGS
jgi:hypothetical protein